MLDPYYERELKKYKNPIPSREYILSLINKKPRTKEQLFTILKIYTLQKKPLLKRLTAMIRDKQINYNTKGFYTKFSTSQSLTGTVIANSKGFGFISVDGCAKDLKLSPQQMKLVFHGDIVEVNRIDKSGYAQIIKVVKGISYVVGQLNTIKNKIYVVIDDKHIKRNIEICNTKKALKNGQIVVVKILTYPTIEKLASGNIIKILGDNINVAIKIKSMIYKYKMPTTFTNKALAEASQFNKKINQQDEKNRVDLTKLKLITIDDEEARDFDDAIYAKTTNNGWRLLVAIADVSHYVTSQSYIDEEAQTRGNSVYFPNTVIPMLPEILSNELCSLNPQEKRLCMACDMNIDNKGDLTNYKFYPAIMRSHKRLTYTEVSKILEHNNANLIKKHTTIIDNLKTLYSLYKTLKDAKIKRGAIDIDKINSKILFDNKGNINNITTYSTNDAYKIVEECMLMANKASAEFLTHNNENFLYRTHHQPTTEKIQATRQLLKALGLSLAGGDQPKPQNFAQVIKKIKNRQDADIIKIILIRTMKRAIYTAHNEGHFGLALNQYTHFTSPIRRYPDLLAHRAIKRILNNKTKKPSKQMSKMGTYFSITEQKADEATQEVIKWLICEYMLNKIGMSFNGIIHKITNSVIFIKLTDTLIEGILPLKDLSNDYYVYNEIKQQLIGKNTKQIFRLGCLINVKIAKINSNEGRIIFALN